MIWIVSSYRRESLSKDVDDDIYVITFHIHEIDSDESLTSTLNTSRDW